MKEKDLEKNLDNLIIDGLIKEAEQDNADFEAAMRKMSDEEFDELIYDHVHEYEYEYEDDYDYDYDYTHTTVAESYSIEPERELIHSYNKPIVFKKAQRCSSDDDFSGDFDDDFEEFDEPKTSKWKVFRPWVISAVAAVAVILIVLIPSMNMMNARLCESALYTSESYITPAKGGFDISNASITEIKEELPNLELRYKECIHDDGKSISYTDDLQEAGWNLVVAYLKLHEKQDAVKVLKVLAQQYGDTDFGRHCNALLGQLD